jgi:hypothetical protein
MEIPKIEVHINQDSCTQLLHLHIVIQSWHTRQHYISFTAVVQQRPRYWLAVRAEVKREETENCERANKRFLPVTKATNMGRKV